MVRRVNLALQGGGAHGAFTWGVLDRLLDDETLEIAAIAGTSAGALNAAVFKAGLLKGGREGARVALREFWERIARQPLRGVSEWWSAWLPSSRAIAQGLEYAPGYIWGDFALRLASPYGTGPFYQNPLETVLDALDLEAVGAEDGPEIFICATNVRSGKVKVFSGPEVSNKALLASACLPSLFRAVEIDDPKTGQREAYWDGGFTGNPALFPLFRPNLPDDIIVVNINPLWRDTVPITAADIQNRVNEISFNSSLLRELRAISFVKRLIADESIAPGSMKDVFIHFIADDALMRELSAVTKLVPNPIILSRLFAAGRRAAETFLDAHSQDIGARSSVDLAHMFG